VIDELGFFAFAFARQLRVFDSCVWFDRFSPWKSTVGLPGS